MAIVMKSIEYTHQGGVLEGVMAWDDASDGPRPGVLVAHTWAGRGEFEVAKACALAELGYVGFAIDMYGKGVLGVTAEENATLMEPFIENREFLQDRIAKTVEVVRAQSEVNAAQIVHDDALVTFADVPEALELIDAAFRAAMARMDAQ